jgi:putative glutamine amidotransferase
VKIGLTQTENTDKHQYYIHWLRNDPGVEVVTLSKKTPVSDLTGIDGIVLSGGTDIHPERYGGSCDYVKAPSNGWDKQRDSFEEELFKSALDNQIPVLGICRGLQLINVALNGTLVQDLGEGDNIHEGNPDKLHSIELKSGTLLTALAEQGKINVNSAHHQAIDRLGEGLMISATAEGNIIEGIEWENPTKKPFLMAVQWHPERMFRFNLAVSPLSQSIREIFLKEVKKTKLKKQ